MATNRVILASALVALATPVALAAWAQGAFNSAAAPAAGRAAAVEKLAGHHGKPYGNHWRRADKDGDGQISRNEWLERPREFIRRTDANGDGKVTQEEFTAKAMERHAERVAAMFHRLDTNGDGILGAEEMTARGNRHFDRLDANRDGYIGKDEIRRQDRQGGRKDDGTPK